MGSQRVYLKPEIVRPAVKRTRFCQGLTHETYKQFSRPRPTRLKPGWLCPFADMHQAKGLCCNSPPVQHGSIIVNLVI